MDFVPEPDSLRPEWTLADLIVFCSVFVITLQFVPWAIVKVMGIFIHGMNTANLSGVAQILIQGALNLIWIGFIFFLIKVVHRRPVMKSLHWVHSGTYTVARLIFLGIILAIIALFVSARFPPQEATPIEQLVESRDSLYLLVAFGILVAPITEEIMFRGFFYGVFSSLGRDRLAIPGTALLFALLHAPQLAGSWAGIMVIFVVGFVLSIIRQRSNSIVPSFIVHTAYNGMLFGAEALSALLQRGHH